MVETISLEVEGKVPQELLEQIYSKITPEYIKGLFGDNKMSIDDNVGALQEHLNSISETEKTIFENLNIPYFGPIE